MHSVFKKEKQVAKRTPGNKEPGEKGLKEPALPPAGPPTFPSALTAQKPQVGAATWRPAGRDPELESSNHRHPGPQVTAAPFVLF